MEKSSCCFLGHRKIANHEQVKLRVRETVEMLAKEKGVRIFHFGSKSEFDDICHLVVSELKEDYPDIVRVNYNCKSEYVVKPEEKGALEESVSRLLKKEVRLKEYERSKISERVLNARKASYIERNEDMIDDSEYCVVFYMEGYKPAASDGYSIRKSGVKIAYAYAKKKGKIILNVAGENV